MFIRSNRAQTGRIVQPFFTHLQTTNRLALIARGILAVWMTPIMAAFVATIALCFTPSQAQAQTAPRAVVVLDFSVAEGLDPLLGRKAADAFAVELANSREYTVVPRERVVQAVENTAGLTPPFTESTQSRLGRAVNASSIFSGKVHNVATNDGKTARVQVEVRQLDVLTEDFINGAVISEPAGDQLQQIDNDILVDQAINKVAASAVRSLKQTQPLTGVVLNITKEDVEINLGTRNGVAEGQVFSVLRDIHDPARNVTERLKVAEIQVVSTGADQSTARQKTGALGVKTGDRIRRVFDTRVVAHPVAASGTTGSSANFPVSSGGGNTFVKKSGNLLIGLGALAGLVALAGFGGGSSGTRVGETAPGGVSARAVQPGISDEERFLDPNFTGGGFQLVNPDIIAAQTARSAIRFSFTNGLPGILRESTLGYIIYRDGRRHDVIEFPTQTTYTDHWLANINRVVTITPSSSGGGTTNNNNNNNNNTNNNNNNNNGGSTGAIQGGITVINQDPANTTDPNNPNNNNNNNNNNNSNSQGLVIGREMITPGRQYRYQAQRVDEILLPATGNNNNNTNNNNNNNNTNNNNNNSTGGTTGQIQFTELSAFSGTATAVPKPLILPATGYNLDNFQVQIDNRYIQTLFDGTLFIPTIFTPAYPNTIDEFYVQVGTSPTFTSGTFFEQVVRPTQRSGQTVTLRPGLGTSNNIVIPGYQPGENLPLFLRVGARNSSDTLLPPGGWIFSNTETISNISGGLQTLGSRFLPAGGNSRQVGGAGLPNSPTGSLNKSGNRRTPGRVNR